MPAPQWVRTGSSRSRSEDVLRYLVGRADLPRRGGRTFDIGGPDVLSYADLIRRYASVAGPGAG